MAARSLRPMSVVLGLAMLSAACGSAVPSSAPGATDAGSSTTPKTSPTLGATSAASLPPEFQHVYDIPADPIAVTPSVDATAAVEAQIPTSGGTLALTAADGTKFELTVPADALPVATRIRMIPVVSLDGMPFGASPHAVQLEPEGMHFLDFVTLAITPTAEIPVDQQVLFGWQGAGKNLTLALPADRSKAISIKLLHFSGAGVTTATSAQVAAVQARLGADAEARITNAIAAELGRARQAELDGTAGSDVDYTAILGFLGQFYAEVVKPRVAAAGQSCAAGTLAIQTYLGYHRQLQLLGAGESDDMSDEPDLVKTVGLVCVREEYQHCHDQHVIQNMVPVWLSWERNYQLLGVVDETASSTLQDYARKCLVFQMKFESQASLDDSSGTGWDSAVRATVELRFDPEAMRFNFIQGELVNFAFTFKASGDCKVTSTPGGGTFNAIDFKYVRDTKSPTDEVGYVRDLEFGYNPGATSESVTLKCPGKTFTIPNAGFWSGTWLALHKSEGGVHGDSFSFIATDWEILGGAYYAKKEWIKHGDGLVEAGTLKLYHTPE